MDQQGTKTKANRPAVERPPLFWGLRAGDFYRTLANKPVQLGLLDGKQMTGELVGHDQYELLIKQSNGPTILVYKHSIKWICLAPANGAIGKTPNA